jgi:hypothetical protein
VAPARLYINDEYFGFYTIVERVNELFLERNFGESTGDLFDWTPSGDYRFEYLGDDPGLYWPVFLDAKTNEDNPDVEKFVEMVRIINQSSDAELLESLAPYLDVRMYLTQAAVECAMAELDGIWADTYGMNNIYLYRFGGQKLFQFLTWDKDLTMLHPEREPFQGTAGNVLARRLLAIPELRDHYLDSLGRAATLMGGPGGWADREIDRLYELIRETAIDDPHKQCIQDGGAIAGCGALDFEQGITESHAFIGGRLAYVRTELGRIGYVPPPDAPVIEEIVTGSGSDTVTFGDRIAIRGVRLGAEAASGDSYYPRQLGGTFVAIEGVRVPLVSVSSGEIVAQVPADIQTGIAALTVNVNGKFSGTRELVVVAPSTRTASDLR